MTQAGDTVAGYQLVRQVGEGPFGVVWQAQDARGVPLAVKLLRASFIQRPAGQAAFTRLLASLRVHELLAHENLARLFGPIQDIGHPAYGMACEYVEGRLVSEIRMPSGQDAQQDLRSLAVVLSWFEQLGEVLAWLHAQGIVHGNLKPNNVKLVREPHGHRIKILDLPWSAIGLAAPVEGAQSYLAPEQLGGAPPSAFSDQWSMAKMLSDIIASRPGIVMPQNLGLTIQRATHPEPGFRFAQVLELVGALRVVRGELTRPAGGGYGAYPPFAGMQPAAPDASFPGVVPMGVGSPMVAASPTASTPGVSGVQAVAPAFVSSMPTAPADDAEAVFVPTARALGTTSSGGLPETGEHETLLRPPTSAPKLGPTEADPAVSLATSALHAETPEELEVTAPPVAEEPKVANGGLEFPTAPAAASAVANFSARRGDTLPMLPPRSDPDVAVEDERFDAGPSYLGPVVVVLIGLLVAVGIGFAVRMSNDVRAPLVETAGDPALAGRATDDAGTGEDAGSTQERNDAKVAKASSPVRSPKAAATKSSGDGPQGPPPRPDSPPRPDPAPSTAQPEAASVDTELEDAQIGCDEGDGESCIEVSDYYSKAGDGRGAYLAAKRACEFNHVRGCMRAGGALATRRPELAIGFYQRACEVGSADGCHRAAELARAGQGVGNPDLAAKLDEQACQLGRTKSCRPTTTSTIP